MLGTAMVAASLRDAIVDVDDSASRSDAATLLKIGVTSLDGSGM